MEKLNKFQIHTGNTMTKEELLTLKGGVRGGTLIKCIFEDLSECNGGYFAGCPDGWEAAAVCMAVCPGSITSSFNC